MKTQEIIKVLKEWNANQSEIRKRLMDLYFNK